MILKLKKSLDGKYGYVEKYKSYRYNSEGYIEVLCSITIDGDFSPLYAFKGEKFVPLKEIEETVGIDKYLKAKKPIYSLINEGFVVSLRVPVDYKNEIVKEGYSYNVYVVNDISSNITNGEIALKSVLNVPETFKNILNNPIKVIGGTFGDRLAFLRSRI